MFRIARAILVATGIVVSSFGVASQAQASTSPDVPAVASSPDPSTAAPNSESDPPEAAINPAVDMTVKAGLRLTFDGTVSSDPLGEGLQYEWRSTGRRGVASTKSVYSRKFPKPGRYFVKLTVIDAEGRQSSQQIWVTAVENEPPVATFTPGENQTVKTGERLTFDGSTSSDPDGDGLRFEWRSTGRRGVASTKSVYSRKFPKAGRYFVELTVIDAEGQRSSKRVWVTAAKNQRPVADFTPGTNQTIEVGQQLTFNGNKSSDPEAGLLQYQWRSTGIPKVASTESIYTRTFDSPGRYSVVLTVIDDGGLKKSKRTWITVTQSEPPVVVVKSKNYQPEPDWFYIEIGVPFKVDGSQSFDPDGGPLRFEWRLNNKDTGESMVISRAAKFTHTIPDDGRYWDELMLTVTDDEGDVTMYNKEIALIIID